ncbi:hypothetical protein KI387_011897, partial [Taxus chinensis]
MIMQRHHRAHFFPRVVLRPPKSLNSRERALMSGFAADQISLKNFRPKFKRCGTRAASIKEEETEEGNSPSGTCDPLCSMDEISSSSSDENHKQKNDLWKALTVFSTVAAGAAVLNHSWVADHQDLVMVSVFTLGYAGIIFEKSLAFNKSGVALLMAVSLWVIRSIAAPSIDVAVHELSESSAEMSQIVFFLLGAMTIVEIVDAHQGFKLVTDKISTRKPYLLLWMVAMITFFLSAILDNLTSTIVMVSLLRKLVPDRDLR